MAVRKLLVTEEDYIRLVELVADMRGSSDPDVQRRLDMLEAELDLAHTIRPDRTPPDVVTMNSQVQFHDVGSGETAAYTITYPAAADIAQDKISVLAPIGMALLGYKVGDEVEWDVPAGKRRFVIEKIVFQPEAAGRYDL